MAFKASKVRKKRDRLPVAEGTQLFTSAAIREWYEGQLRAITRAMLGDYEKTIEGATKTKTAKQFFAQDASAASIFNEVLAALDKKWLNIFKNYAKVTAAAFTEKVDKHSKSTVWHSLSVAGVDAPAMAYTEAVSNTIKAAQDFNNTLITSIQEETHQQIYTSVMLSLTSPDPTQQGLQGIAAGLREAGIKSEKRIDLIARDQNSKLYASLNTERMKQNGVEKFRWVHSSAGKVPRPSHVAKDGKIFLVDDPELWTGPKADQGPPGWAINCRCRAVPVID
ncbi:head morphogenesis protein [Luteibacter phage vB_LflM-Pluto]|uniref:Head morphogenesis protein n=1 Tax=Luteibacter phage vB_LflM-Pluto TaxID=2948611 RepID=A0A9E7MTD3_9CAUD|nr:head morphogenesis protein [Luteibacter phage vB_LflM-Pluto]